MNEKKLLDREWLIGAQPQQDQLTVLQWNCLANWASNSFPRVDSKFLVWEYRRPLIIAECIRAEPDVICLQEVDNFDDLEHAFRPKYDGYHFRKRKKGHPEGRDGNAIFWKRDRIRALGSADSYFWRACDRPEMGQIFTATRFAFERQNGKKTSFRVLATHLKAKIGFDEERQLQCSAMARFLNTEDPPFELTIVCGDFNTGPESAAIRSLIQNTKTMKLKSVYDAVSDNHSERHANPEWTTWKIRERVKKETIDFIFFDERSRWKPVDVWRMPDEKLIDPEVGLPCQSYPSDHCALAAKFELNN